MMPAIRQQAGVSLSSLLSGLLDSAQLAAVADTMVDGIAQDSREVGTNYLFIAVGGMATHGLRYAEQAVEAGASVVLSDDTVDYCGMMPAAVAERVLCLQMKALQDNIGEIAARFFDRPSRHLNLIGVTGTDGKTSVSHYLAQCLDSESAPCGVLGTLGNGLIHDLKPTGLTTASAVQVQRSLARLVAEGARAAAMEVSSHGLDQGRVNAVEFDTAIFTNLSQDHLDYHGSMDAYFEAKARLFAFTGLSSAVINLDDRFGRALAENYRNRLTVYGYSLSPDARTFEARADRLVYAEDIRPTTRGFEIEVMTPAGAGRFELGLLGRFNVSNTLAVLATLLLNDLSLEDALQRLRRIRPVAGRMELISVAGGPTVIVDYAHTPQALKAAGEAARQHFNGRLWCVFGCGGDRDRDKRPLMARAAEAFADRVIVTSDNPRHEDPRSIIEQIIDGFSRPRGVASYIDRREAMATAIARAAAEDVILIAGKGHESCQIVGDTRLDFDDRAVARELLEGRAEGVGQ